MNCFRVDYCGRGELADRQQKLNQFLSKLTHMAEGSSLILLTIFPGTNSVTERIQRLRLDGTFPFQKKASETTFITCTQTNQVQSDPGANALFAGADGRKPVGGHILAHASTTRLLLRKGRGEERVAKIVDSPGKSSCSARRGSG